jgi:MFS family permease
LLVLGSIGVGRANTVRELLLWRIVQAIGTVGGISIGAGVIGDIYKLEERGTAMGVFYSVSCLIGIESHL